MINYAEQVPKLLAQAPRFDSLTARLSVSASADHSLRTEGAWSITLFVTATPESCRLSLKRAGVSGIRPGRQQADMQT